MAEIVKFETNKDSQEYLQGITIAEKMELGMGKFSWLQPGVTYTSHVLNEAGKIMIPVVRRGEAGGITSLCEDGKSSGVTTEWIEVPLDKKVSQMFDSCFTIAGTVPKNWEQMINSAKLKVMQEEWQEDVEKELETKATAFSKSSADYASDPRPCTKLLSAMRTEYRKKTKRWPTVCLVSLAFSEQLADEKLTLNSPAMVEQTYVSGNVGVYKQMLIVPTDLETDAIMYTVEALNLARAGSLKQIPAQMVVGEGVDLGALGVEFSSGYISKIDVKAQGIGSNTWVHKPFGTKCIEELILKSKVVPAP